MDQYISSRDQLPDAIAEEKIAQADPITEAEDDPFILVKGLIGRIISASEMMPWLLLLWSREIVNEGGMLREKMFRHLPFEKLALFVNCIINRLVRCIFLKSSLRTDLYARTFGP